MKKTLKDLEFPAVLQEVASRCNTDKGRLASLDIVPLSSVESILENLGVTSEYLASFSNENRIPNHGFDEIDEELKLLGIENTMLEIDGFKKIHHLVSTFNIHKKFFKKFKEYYPLLLARTTGLEDNKEIPNYIDDIIDRFGEVRENASPELRNIRRAMQEERNKINQSFASALQKYLSSEFLDEIRESIVDNRRVLAVKAMYRRKVKGNVLGTSKTGSIVFIEPDSVMRYSRQLIEY